MFINCTCVQCAVLLGNSVDSSSAFSKGLNKTTMDPSLLSSLLDESQVRGYLRDNAIHMQVKAGTKIKNLTEYVSKRLENGDCDQIFCWGLPRAIEKVVPFAEKVKSIWLAKFATSSDSPSLYQCTRLFFHPIEMKIENYLVKANKPAMVILLSRQKLVETGGPEAVSVIPMAEQEIPATETPFPSRRKKCHQQKKRRREERDGGGGTAQNMARSKNKKRKAKQTQEERKGVERSTSEERVFDPCHRLIPANKLAGLAVAKIKDVNQSPMAIHTSSCEYHLALVMTVFNSLNKSVDVAMSYILPTAITTTNFKSEDQRFDVARTTVGGRPLLKRRPKQPAMRSHSMTRSSASKLIINASISSIFFGDWRSYSSSPSLGA
ncbi:hypothetical protein EGR_05784 [Echinococcus granulosus]|uniref:Uncharacterized protein n=1 Tax=Echinococcus granulosus TaxID=6210 RepID=W6UDA3_ECHGR|nr:hypothetical protein EGR_05784 [Echinococcus granulosus]EUB59300.1 hypothetical protein EGR_05784 [Echinococcus granulosus]